MLWHDGHNLFIQQIFMSMTADTGMTYYFVDDFGLGVLVESLILGVVFWAKRPGRSSAQAAEKDTFMIEMAGPSVSL